LSTAKRRLPLDVVVVTWNSRAMVLRCIESVDTTSIERLVVVDNASSDGTEEAVRELHPEAELLRLEREEGLAFAYNRGAELGTAELVLFLNDDVLVTESGLSALFAALAEREVAVAAAGRLVDPGDGATQVEYLPQPFPSLSAMAAMLIGRRRRRPPAWSGLDHSQAVPVDQPPGACLLVRREAFAAVGGWDEDFAFWYEDVDLARRLRSHGEILYVPRAAFEHVGGHSAARLTRAQIVSRHYRGALLYAGKHFLLPSRVGAGLLFALVGALRLPFAGGDERGVYSRVLRDGVRTAFGRQLPPR
jgi:N-acetylglucosaminyl-diphospho-decaprenol L-rhamnosyltransferase